MPAYKNICTKVGPIKGTRLLTNLKQIEVFDCPGCAWPESHVSWQQMKDVYRLIRDGFSQVIADFEHFNQRIGELEELEELGEFELPNGVRDERKFVTATGKVNFVVHGIESIHVPEGCLLMLTIHSHDQFNTNVYTNNDRYRGIHGSRRIVFVNVDDLKDLNLKAGQQTDVHRHWPT